MNTNSTSIMILGDKNVSLSTGRQQYFPHLIFVSRIVYHMYLEKVRYSVALIFH